MEQAKVAADGGHITNYMDSYIGDLDPVTQDVVIRRAFSLGVKKIHGFLTVQGRSRSKKRGVI